MKNYDQLLRFNFENSDARGEIVRVKNSLQEVLNKHDYPLPIQALLAEIVAAASLLSATIKFDGLLTIQARGSGPITTLMAECSNTQEIRAIAQWDETTQLDDMHHHEIELKNLLGNATLAITIAPTVGERYQGIVPLEDGKLAQCLESYFLRSEQIKTRIWLATEFSNELNRYSSSTGFLLQHLPGKPNPVEDSTARETSQDWGHLVHITDTLKSEELLHLDFEEILHRLYHQDPIKLHESVPIRFACSCSKERTAQVLSSIGIEDLKALSEKQKEISIKCQFCNENYVYDRVDIGLLVHKASINPTQQ
ncbi:MAG: Hsp33 family molecular chaperone HslO [Pseudomonadales bacterium]|nr:Hsp33 family molecular chaperone HslO [Pseudomonadales bacterium]